MSILYSNASFRTHVLAQNKVKIYTKKSFQNTIMPLFNTSKKLYVYNSNLHNWARGTQGNPAPQKQAQTCIKEGWKGVDPPKFDLIDKMKKKKVWNREWTMINETNLSCIPIQHHEEYNHYNICTKQIKEEPQRYLKIDKITLLK